MGAAGYLYLVLSRYPWPTGWCMRCHLSLVILLWDQSQSMSYSSRSGVVAAVFLERREPSPPFMHYFLAIYIEMFYMNEIQTGGVNQSFEDSLTMLVVEVLC